MAAPVITPGGPLTKDGGSSTNLTANQPVTWTASGGTLSNVTATTVTWTAPNETGNRTVTATNGLSENDFVTIGVTALVPQIWGWKIPKHAKKNVLKFIPIYGPSQTQGFGDNKAIHDWELGSETTSLESFQLMKAFWDYHHPHRQFDLIDPILNERRRYETDSDFDFSNSRDHANSWQWSCRIKEAYPYAVIA